MVENGTEAASRGLCTDLDSAARDLLQPRLGSSQKDDGGKGGNRTLDPGIMSALPKPPWLDRDPLVDLKSLIILTH